MKTILLSIFFLLLMQQLSSQNYFPFTDLQNQWAVVEEYGNGGASTTYFKCTNDTVINGTVYKKVYSTNDPTLTGWYPENYFVRETTDHKVFRFMDGSEQLIYDFELSVGDSIYVTTMLQDVYGFVEMIDSVMINNEYRKRIALSWNELWIEGIGSLTSPFFPFINMGVADLYYYLLCAHNADVLLYQHPGMDSCYYESVGITEIQKLTDRIVMTPNPVTDLATIRIDSKIPAICAYTLYDSRLNELFSGTFEGTAHSFNTSQLPGGLYLLRISTNGETAYKKLVKQ